MTGYTLREGVGATERLAHVFIPGPPLPTTGVLVAVPEDQLFSLDLSVEDALKLVLSAGMVTPPSLRERTRASAPAPLREGVSEPS